MNPKNTFEDIIPPASANNNNNITNNVAKRSIRDIPIREKKPNKIDELLEETADMRAEHHVQQPVYVPQQPPVRTERTVARSHKGLWSLVIVAVVVALGIGGLMFFRGANVNIALKTESIPVDLTITSTSEMTASGTLPYKVLPIQKEGTKEVAATGAPTKIEKKATGTIIIYNNFSAADQQLIATTRFETPGGLIYRIDKPVTVPGNGSTEAVVTAEQAGDKYNAAKQDFTIPGFKGTTKYDKFYARSKTALSGGFIGNMPKIADADLKTANEELEKALTAQAITELDTQRPADYVSFKNGVRTTFTSSVAPSAEGKAIVSGKVILEALIFEKKAIEKAIADTKNGKNYVFDNLGSLNLTIQNTKALTSFISNPVLSLKFDGTLTTGQSFDPDVLKNVLAGKSRSQLTEILKMYPEITKAEANTKPFWISSFPENPEKITINVTK